ncbi:hypothetical protein TIFTF001_020318 [Ficus carica]|uniref:ATP synthase subunit d, mitochondrial n=1 Tax=Ficus carica TaxID=3494 RepID=A0AA88A8D7_FICCA|nr:hypothetical protein TIFTF001_020318 [Ficus carica]
MSGPSKKVVDVALKASRNIDWDGMAKLLVSDEARKEFVTLRRTFDEVNSALQTKFSQEPEPIDWEYYRKGIGSRLVDMYKEAYDRSLGFVFWELYRALAVCFELNTCMWNRMIRGNADSIVGSISRVIYTFQQSHDSRIEIPKYVDTVTPQYKPKFDALLVELKEAEEKSLKESERLEKEIAEVQELKKKISTMTAEEYFEKHPELKKKFDDEIRNDYWGY